MIDTRFQTGALQGFIGQVCPALAHPRKFLSPGLQAMHCPPLISAIERSPASHTLRSHLSRRNQHMRMMIAGISIFPRLMHCEVNGATVSIRQLLRVVADQFRTLHRI
jgi:hypothetical protein